MSTNCKVHGEICHLQQSPSLVEVILRFRKNLFVDQLGWPLSVRDGMEVDEFDTENAIYCALKKRADVVGGFRAIRTDNDYLACTVFPELASAHGYPRRHDIWEISRFGVTAGQESVELARYNYALMFRFALDRQAKALVALADPVYERYLSLHGVRTKRYGTPQTIEHRKDGQPIKVVAGEITLAEQYGAKFQALIHLANNLDVRDATLVQRPQQIPA